MAASIIPAGDDQVNLAAGDFGWFCRGGTSTPCWAEIIGWYLPLRGLQLSATIRCPAVTWCGNSSRPPNGESSVWGQNSRNLWMRRLVVEGHSAVIDEGGKDSRNFDPMFSNSPTSSTPFPAWRHETTKSSCSPIRCPLGQGRYHSPLTAHNPQGPHTNGQGKTSRNSGGGADGATNLAWVGATILGISAFGTHQSLNPSARTLWTASRNVVSPGKPKSPSAFGSG
jgi:hypothetical protein